MKFIKRKKHNKNYKDLASKIQNKRIKNTKNFTTIDTVDESGTIYLKTGEVAQMFEIEPIDLSLTSSGVRMVFYNQLKFVYQIKNLNLKCYKLDRKLNLNSNKLYYNDKQEYEDDETKKELLEERLGLINYLEEKEFTNSSVYIWVVISKNINDLNKCVNEINNNLYNTNPRIDFKKISNRLEIFSYLCNIYNVDTSLSSLISSDIQNLITPYYIKEKINSIEFDDKEIQMVSIRDLPPFIDELFLETIYNIPNIRCSLSVKDSLNQDELIRWINSQYQFLLADRNTTKKLSDATELDIQKENYQILMSDIKSGDEKIKEVSLSILISGTKEERDESYEAIKQEAKKYQIKVEIPKLRQMEVFKNYDISSQTLKDYNFYLPTISLSASFPFTKSSFKDDQGYLLGVDMNTDLPVFFDLFTLNNSRTSHNLAIVSSTGGGKSFTMKKIIANEFSRGSKVFIFDAENEYEKIVKNNNGLYLDLYSRKGGVINPFHIRYIASEEKNVSLKDCPLSKHLSFLETFFKVSFEDIKEKEIIVLLNIVEKLYESFGITKYTTIDELRKYKNEDYPIFSDLNVYIKEVRKLETNKDTLRIINQIEILLSRFFSGTDSYLFDAHTDIDLNNDLIAFNLQQLLFSENTRLKKTQILNLLSFLSNHIVANKIINEELNNGEKKHFCIIADEFHLYADDENNVILRSLSQFARRIRKYSGSMIVSSQSIKDFVGNSGSLKYATAIFNNCQYQLTGMLKEDDLRAYTELFKQNPLTNSQTNYLSLCTLGQFLMIIDNKKRLKLKVEVSEKEKEIMGEE